MSFLEQILERKRREIDERRRNESERALEKRLEGKAPAKSLYAALAAPGGPVRIIAEVKRASPSAGAIRKSLNPLDLATRYASAGAAVVSVLTDGPGFGGSLEDLDLVRTGVTLPLLRKDFILDRYQLLEARLHGADAVLLIVAALTPDQLQDLRREAERLDLEALVEVHDEDELEIALASGATVIGVNNRDLKTFGVDLATSERLIVKIPPSVRSVAESGIRGPEEIERLRRAGASNFLIGEALVRAGDAAALLRRMREVR